MFNQTNKPTMFFVNKNRISTRTIKVTLLMLLIAVLNLVLMSQDAVLVFGQTVYEGGGSHFTNGITITASNPIDISDWNSVPELYWDDDDIPGSSNQMDWLSVKVAHNNDNLFMLLQNDGPIAFNYGTQVFMDTDANSSTGYIGTGGEFPVGTDVLIQGDPGGIYIYEFSGYYQTDWSWTRRPYQQNMPQYTWGSGFLEMRIPLTWLGSPDRVHFYLDGDNTPMGNGYSNDYVPDGIHNWNGGDYMAYTLNGTSNPGNPGGGTVVPPQPGASWWWQLQNTASLNTNLNVDVYNIDLDEGIEYDKISELNANGKYVICYISGGTYENWRSADFPSGFADDGSIYVGNTMQYWPEEKWLNIGLDGADLQVIKNVMLKRLNNAKDAGCDGMEFDNVDVYNQNYDGYSTWLDVTWQDQIDWNIFLAQSAQARGMAAGLKNNVEQIQALEPYFDFAVNEQCYRFIASWGGVECWDYDYFASNGKAVFSQSYGTGPYALSWGEFVDACYGVFNELNFSVLWSSEPNQLLDGNYVSFCP